MNDALQTFYFDHRFETLVGCACSRIVGETMARSEDKGKEWKERCEDWTRKQREFEEDSGKDRDLSWGCWQFSKRNPTLTSAVQRDVEMADPAPCLNLWLQTSDG
ncbi:hypothetical protein UPYG_G00295730 [Umbra pygmaea]|uniref:Uncharacterized protein n=1 Tax=Umbra pygmaea TaxID=75934 RepID=A0ABD0WLR9_UMBPY